MGAWVTPPFAVCRRAGCARSRECLTPNCGHSCAQRSGTYLPQGCAGPSELIATMSDAALHAAKVKQSSKGSFVLRTLTVGYTSMQQWRLSMHRPWHLRYSRRASSWEHGQPSSCELAWMRQGGRPVRIVPRVCTMRSRKLPAPGQLAYPALWHAGVLTCLCMCSYARKRAYVGACCTRRRTYAPCRTWARKLMRTASLRLGSGAEHRPRAPTRQPRGMLA